MYQSGGTIQKLVEGVKKQKYILPAIQREFVWKPEQICQLFDSLMRGYPFGTFLFWKIEPENLKNYQFYEFITDFHQKSNSHCEELNSLPAREFVAVLDGQQRITSLNIGLRGSYAWKLPGQRWSSTDAFPQRWLYLNLFGNPSSDEGVDYQFDFLVEAKANAKKDGEYWFKVSRILDEDIDDLEDELEDIDNKELRREAKRKLKKLYRTIHYDSIISFYEEAEQSLERVLNIFIRMNSGGTALSYSDLLLSVAVAQWSNLNAREEIHQLVDEMNSHGDGFSFSKDLVLKAGLMLSDIGSVGFKVENFNKPNMEKLESNWSAIKEALLLTIRLLDSFGFNNQNLRADSVILPIAYYLYFAQHDDDYLSKSKYTEDRGNLRLWMIRSLLKSSGIWGSGLDTLLTDLRKVIKEFGETIFPVEHVEKAMAARGKSLSFDEEEVEQLLEIKYGDKRTFGLLTLMFSGFNFSHSFHVDHIYPKSRFTEAKLGKLGVPKSQAKRWAEMANSLPNLQLLEGSINNEKRQKMPLDWYTRIYPDVEQLKYQLNIQAIDHLPEGLLDFPKFYSQRRKSLGAKIRNFLKIKEGNDDSSIDSFSWPNYAELEKIQLNVSLLGHAEKKMLAKASKEIGLSKGASFTVANLVYDWLPMNPSGQSGGLPVQTVIKNLISIIKEELLKLEGLDDEALENSLITASLLRVDKVFNLSAKQVDNILSADLDLFLSSSDDRTKSVICSRFGLDGQQQETLEAVGHRLGVTRERVRQLEVKALKSIKQSLSLTPTVIRLNVSENLSRDFKSIYSLLASRFGRESDLYQFVELISEANKGEFLEIVRPSFSVGIIDEWYLENKSPMPLGMGIELLEEHYGCGKQQATNAIFNASEEGKLKVDGDFLMPVLLKKVAAVTQAALYFPQGVNFREIHSLANQQGFCKTTFPLDRQENGIQGAVDNGYLYLCDRGEYKHIKYCPLDENDIDLIIKEVKELLKNTSEEALHLKMGVYEYCQSLQIYDYYDVRHVIRAFGEKEGVFFAGKSGADTVSLDDNVTQVGQLQAILELFRSEGKPKTKEDISKVIRSGSVNHASYYISELVDKGDLVRVDLNHYTVPEVAFNKAPIEEVIEIAKEILNLAKRPVDVGVVAEKCNAKLHMTKTKAWYMSVLRFYYRSNDMELYTYHNLISAEPLNEISIHSVIRNALSISDNTDEIIKIVNKNLKAPLQTIKNAIHNVRTTSRMDE